MPAASSSSRFVDLVVDGQGNRYVAGLFSGSLQLSQGTLTSQGADIVVAQLKPDFTWSWGHVAGSPKQDSAPRLTIDANNRLYLAGVFGSSVSLFRDGASTSKTLLNGAGHTCAGSLSTDGVVRWALCAGGGVSNQLGGLATSASGGSWLTFSMWKATELRCDGQNLLQKADPASSIGHFLGVAFLDAQGKCRWGRSAGSEFGRGRLHPVGTALDAQGHAYVAGTLEGTVRLGSVEVTSEGEKDGFVTKIAPDGTFQWTTRFGGVQRDEVRGVVVDKAGHVYVAGSFEGVAKFGAVTLSATLHRNLFVARLDAQGKPSWAVSLGSDKANETVDGFGVSSDGFLFLAGTFSQQTQLGPIQLSSRGGSDIFVVQMGPWGRVHGVFQAGGQADDSVSGLVVGPKGLVHILGAFRSATATFGNVQVSHPQGGGSPHAYLWLLPPYRQP